MRTAIQCPLCIQPDTLAPFQQRRGLDGTSVQLDICRRCTAIVCRTALEEHRQEHQREGSSGFYQPVDNLDAAIEARVGIITDGLLAAAPDIGRDVFADVGAGTGFLSAAARRYFATAWAIDDNLPLLQQLPADRGVSIGASVTELPFDIDAVTMWHTVEHLTDALTPMKEIVNRLRPGGALFFQVPTLRREYIVDTHYTFLSETAARILCASLNLTDVWVGFDMDNDFLTCLGRKPDGRGARGGHVAARWRTLWGWRRQV